MKFYYQVITTPTADTPGTTILLHFSDKRYFFGQIPEGTQRVCTERGVKTAYVRDIFLTGRTEWASNGGLLGLVLTKADAMASSAAAAEEAWREKEARKQRWETAEQTSERLSSGGQKGRLHGTQDGRVVEQASGLTIHGGRNVSHMLATARRFIFRKGIPIYTNEYDSKSMSGRPTDDKADPCEQPTWADEYIKVWAMPIAPSTSQNSGRVSEDSSPKSPRKRSLDEFQERDVAGEAPDQHDKDQLVRKAIIHDMFNSQWRLDSLVEMPLAEVKLPATIFVRNPETKDLEHYKGPLPGDKEPVPDIKVLVREPWPAATVEKLPPTTRSEEALSYIVRNHDIRGKFDPNKAQELKVRKGPDYAALTRGQNVQSEDGKTITPDMVLGPPRRGKAIAIIDLPTADYVENLINRPEWKSPAIAPHLEAFIWILGPGVGEHPRLRAFVASMSKCKHIVSSTDYCPNYLALHGVAGSSIRLARLKGDNYSVPVHDNVTLPQPGTPTAGSKKTIEAIKNSPFEPAERGLVIDVEPNFALNRNEVVPLFNPAKMVQRIPRSVDQRMKAIRHRLKKPSFQKELEELRKDLPGADVEIITLGTGSSLPSKYRNVSATLVNVPGYGYYLLDCGENTLGQLKRVYEPDQLREVLRNLRLIWISHLHADHHLGTVSVIKAWYNENYGGQTPSTNDVETDLTKILQEKRLFVVSDEMMINWLEEYASVENYGFDKLVPLAAYSYKNSKDAIKTNFAYRYCRGDGTYVNGGGKVPSTTLRFGDSSSPLTPLLRSATGLSDILTTRVAHCRGALAVSLVFPDGFKLSYSGDCRPSASFAAIGRDSTVLVHEATFQDDMRGSAIAKKHCTMAEALEVGRQMRARTIILTHFSQRYQKIARVDQQLGTVKKEDADVAEPATTSREPANMLTEPEDSPLNDSAVPANDDITVSETRPAEQQQRRAPFTTAFDYMRLRVRDVPISQAFSPALDKLFTILERADAEEAENRKKEEQEAESKKQTKQKGKNDKKKAPAPAPAEGKAEKRVSAWSASESESGWGVSESESEMELKVGSQRRSRSRSADGKTADGDVKMKDVA